jgi:adenine-specific DNA-methyltransferase
VLFRSPLFGKTRKFDRTGLRSPFSQRAHAADALRRLVAGTRARHIFVSYSSEGILSRDEILSLLSAAGEASVREIPYPVFGNGAGVSVRRNVTEYLFHVSAEPGASDAPGGDCQAADNAAGRHW